MSAVFCSIRNCFRQAFQTCEICQKAFCSIHIVDCLHCDFKKYYCVPHYREHQERSRQDFAGSDFGKHVAARLETMSASDLEHVFTPDTHAFYRKLKDSAHDC